MPFLLKEETPCDLLHPNGSGDLVVVAYGQAQQRKENEIAHFKKVEDSNWRVSVDMVIRDYENLPLPFPQPEVDMNTLLQAHLSFIEWPCDWIRFSNEVTYDICFFFYFLYMLIMFSYLL